MRRRWSRVLLLGKPGAGQDERAARLFKTERQVQCRGASRPSLRRDDVQCRSASRPSSRRDDVQFTTVMRNHPQLSGRDTQYDPSEVASRRSDDMAICYDVIAFILPALATEL